MFLFLALIGISAANPCEDAISQIMRLAETRARLFTTRSPQYARNLAMDEDDIAQELAIIAWKYLDRFDPSRGSLKSFLGQKMIWQAATIARRAHERGPTHSLTENEDNPIDPETYDPTPEDPSEVQALRAALKILPKARRAHFEMYLRGHTYEDIGLHFGIKPVRARKSISQSARDLRSYFESL